MAVWEIAVLVGFFVFVIVGYGIAIVLSAKSGDCPECCSKNIRWESRNMTAWRSGNRCLDCGCVFDIYDPANGYGGGRCEIVKHGNWKKHKHSNRKKHKKIPRRKH